MRQSEEWNCGAAALLHLLEPLNVRISLERLDRMLGADPSKGTSPEAFCAVLRALGLKFDARNHSSIDDLRRHLPALVGFQCEGEGHYGVAESWTENGLVVWDPWTGGNRWYTEAEWNLIWRSERYPGSNCWWLHVLLDQGEMSEEHEAWLKNPIAPSGS